MTVIIMIMIMMTIIIIIIQNPRIIHTLVHGKVDHDLQMTLVHNTCH